MDSYLPADFFIVEESAFVSGLRDWSKPRGPYPGAKRPRPSREKPPAMPLAASTAPRRRVALDEPMARVVIREIDEEWHSL